MGRVRAGGPLPGQTGTGHSDMPWEATVYSVGLQMWARALMQKGCQAMESNEKGVLVREKDQAQRRESSLWEEEPNGCVVTRGGIKDSG